MTPIEQIRHEDEGVEYWSARELAKAQTACEASENQVSDHFSHVGNMIETGKGAQREIEDWRLSRYACYLIVQNADPEKPIVALGQTYFAVQTRRAELADELAGLSEAERRLLLRDQVGEQNKDLAAVAYGAGVLTGRDFAIFQDHDYMGLYNGEKAADIHARKGLKKSQRILDYMGSEELAANFFRITQTEARIRREDSTRGDC